LADGSAQSVSSSNLYGWVKNALPEKATNQPGLRLIFP